MSNLQATVRAVRDLIAEQQWNPYVAPEVGLLPRVELADTEDAKLLVVPQSESMEMLSRDAYQVDHVVDVGLLYKVRSHPLEEDEYQPYLDLVDAMKEWLDHREVPEVAGRVVAIGQAAPFVREHLEQLRQLTVVFTLTVRIIR